jgi:hypothetical protein
VTAVGEHNLALLAEQAFERRGDYDALLFFSDQLRHVIAHAGACGAAGTAGGGRRDGSGPLSPSNRYPR